MAVPITHTHTHTHIYIYIYIYIIENSFMLSDIYAYICVVCVHVSPCLYMFCGWI